MIALRVPQEVGRLLAQMSGALPGDVQAASEMHVTVVYLGDGASMEQLAAAMVACHKVTRRTSPFTLTCSEVASFDPGHHGTPVILPVQSPELMQLERDLKEELDLSGVSYSAKWPEFKPHVTLSYMPGAKTAGPLPAPVSWGAFDLTIYGADRGDGRVSIALPFVLQNFQLQLEKIAAKLSRSQ